MNFHDELSEVPAGPILLLSPIATMRGSDTSQTSHVAQDQETLRRRHLINMVRLFMDAPWLEGHHMFETSYILSHRIVSYLFNSLPIISCAGICDIMRHVDFVRTSGFTNISPLLKFHALIRSISTYFNEEYQSQFLLQRIYE